ncbi:MAG: hypothetical protein HC901_00670 [Bdellovibrionaceae bacterium]|nr:hypothetical protein [Pseudobdellovibrionaceae bacterium]
MMQPAKKVLQRGAQLPLGQALRASGRVKILGMNLDDFIRQFFTGGATIAIIILVLIMVFLFREGLQFFR